MEFSNEKKRLESGCGAVLQGMAGKKVFVELRNDVYVIGRRLFSFLIQTIHFRNFGKL